MITIKKVPNGVVVALAWILLAGFVTPLFCRQEENIQEMEAETVWTGHDKGVVDIAFSPDGGTLVSGSLDGLVKLWNTADGRVLRTYSEHTDEVTAVGFSFDGAWILSAGYDRLVCARRVSGQDVRRFTDFLGWTSDIALSPEKNEVAVWSMDGNIVIWDWVRDKRALSLEGDRYKWGMALAWSGEGRWLVSARAVLSVWDIDTGRRLSRLEGHTDFVRDLAVSPSGDSLASAGSDKMVNIWSLSTGKLVESLRPEGFVSYTRQGPVLNPVKVPMTTAAFSTDGRLLAAGGAGRRIYIWNTDGWRPEYILLGHRMTVTAVAFSPDGRRIAASGLDKTIRLWNLKGTRPW